LAAADGKGSLVLAIIWSELTESLLTNCRHQESNVQVPLRRMSNSTAELWASFRGWFQDQSARHGFLAALGRSLALLWEFARDSLPARRRQRYGDVDFDWDHRVDTTSATVGWRDRLLGLLHSPYQPTEPGLFQEMLASLQIDFREFAFIDVGSGKGRVLLMAADYPFRRVIGVELLPALHRVAAENIRKYKSDSQECMLIEVLCEDAREFVFPRGPLVLYLFNPLSESGLLDLLSNLERSLRETPRPVFVLYHNPQLEHVLLHCPWLGKIAGTHQYWVFRSLPE
jgi:tRNA G46 methylase TrmB